MPTIAGIDFRISNEFDLTQANFILQTLVSAITGPNISSFLSQLPSRTVYITSDGAVVNAVFSQANNLSTKSFYRESSNGTLLPALDSGPATGSTLKIGIPLLNNAIAGQAVIKVNTPTGTLLLSLARTLFHELAHGVSTDNSFGTDGTNYAGVEALAVAAEDLIYAKDHHQPSRVGHFGSAVANSLPIYQSFDPATPFTNTSSVIFSKNSGYDSFTGSDIDNGTVSKRYYNRSIYLNDVRIVGQRSQGLVNSFGGISQTFKDAISGTLSDQTYAEDSLRFAARTLSDLKSIGNKIGLIGAGSSIGSISAAFTTINIQNITNVLGYSSERFLDGDGHGHTINLVGPAATSGFDVSVGTIRLAAAAGSIILGSSGYADRLGERGIARDASGGILNINATDTLVGASSGHNVLIAGTGPHSGSASNKLQAGAQGDVLIGDSGNDLMQGGAQSDVFVLSGGRDRIVGGGGTDSLILRNITRLDFNSARNNGVVTIRSGSSVTTVTGVTAFVGGDTRITFIGDGHSTMVAGTGGADFTLKAGDTAIGDPSSNVSNIYRVSSKDIGKVRIINFKKNDGLIVDGKRLTYYSVTSKVISSPLVGQGHPFDVILNSSGIQTTVSGSLGGSVNVLHYVPGVGQSPGQFVSTPGSVQTLLELVPSSDNPNSVVSFNFSSLNGSGGTAAGLQLVISGYQDGFGGIKVRSDPLSLSLQYQNGVTSQSGQYLWSGKVIYDDRNKYVDADGVHSFSNQLYSPFSAQWLRFTQGTSKTTANLLANNTTASAASLLADVGGDGIGSAGLDLAPAVASAAFDPGNYEIPDDGIVSLTGTSGADVLSTSGTYNLLVGSGGGDTFEIARGDGLVEIDEQDAGNVPNVLQLGPGIDPATTAVFGDNAGDVILDFGGGDALILKGELLNGGSGGISYGVQQIRFDDGTTWSWSDIMDKVASPSADNTTLFGDRGANSLDSQGIANDIVGNGGGDTFVYNSGYGALTIDEQDTMVDPINLLAFGAGITADSVIVSGTETGDLILDLGGGDVITILGGARGTDSAGVTRGIQSVTFADGTAWSYQDLFDRSLWASNDSDTLYGDANANFFDTGGIASRVVGKGGGDEMDYYSGYGVVTVDEADTAVSPNNLLFIGGGVDPSQVVVTADADGNIMLTMSDTDEIILSNALNSNGSVTYGVQSVQFDDGTSWSYADLLAKIDTPSADNPTLYGDYFANLLDSQGIATAIIGNGGGDTIVYDAGYGALSITEVDQSATPANVLQIGSGLSAGDLSVTGSPDASLILSFGGGDTVTLVGGLTSDGQATYGVQSVVFADGTTLSYADLLALAETASASNLTIYGDTGANLLDTQGIATSAVGGGGGDTFVYARGYGAVTIDERESGVAPANGIQFGAGISGSDLTVTATDSGDILLSLGDGDSITLTNALNSGPDVNYGLQTLVFSDSSTLSYAELLAALGTASAGEAAIYGDSSANVLDSAGLVSKVVGNGGGDTIVYDTGYGALTVDERDSTNVGDNFLQFGSGIDPATMQVSATATGDLILDFGGSDVVTIANALAGLDASGVLHGLQGVLFADGTSYDYATLLQIADTASASNTSLYGDTGANTLSANGFAHLLVGNGGGDTFVFNAGDGAVTIDERDAQFGYANILGLGAGIDPATLVVSGTDSGDLILDFGAGDVVTILGGLIGGDSSGATLGIQKIVFNDGSVLTYADLLQAASHGGTIYGGTGADILDTGGIAGRVVGRGGSDTIYYNQGYGAVVIDERDPDSSADNRLVLGDGLNPSDVSLSSTVDGDIVLDFGGGDSVTLVGALVNDPALTRGVQSVEFANGTIWDANTLKDYLEQALPVDLSSGDVDIDLTSLPASHLPVLNLSAAPADVTVMLSADAQSLLILTPGGTLTLDHIYASNAYANQTIHFGDGTVWTIADALSVVSNLDDVSNVLIGSSSAETFTVDDHFPLISGGGGGDTFRYARGGGAVFIDEAEDSANVQNRIVLGNGFALSDLVVTTDSADPATLKLNFGGGDVVSLIGGAHLTDTSTYGVQSVVFSDGSELSYHDLIALADTGSANNHGTLVGDSFGNVIDTNGFAGNVIGNGGGDTFVYNSGYGPMSLIEADSSATPNNILHLGPGITPDGTQVSGDQDSIRLTFSGSDLILLRGALSGAPDSIQGVQQIVFDDGTIWTPADLLAKVSTPVSGVSSIFGDGSANTLDTAGIANTVYGNGGGDTFVYNVGYGGVAITENDFADNPTNTLAFGAGILPTDVTPMLQGPGFFKLKLAGNDSVTFVGSGSLHTTAKGEAQGVQRVTFADGTIWTYAQLLAMADTASATQTTLYGDAGANDLDPAGIAHVINGGGGGDTIHYDAGYGSLAITEQEKGSATNALEFGAGIAPSSVSVGTYQGKLILSLGGSDYVTINPGTLNFGVGAIRFSDGTIWDAATIAALRSPVSTGDATQIKATTSMTGAVLKDIGVNGATAPIIVTGSIDFGDLDPNDQHTAVLTAVSLQTNNGFTFRGFPSLDGIRSWFSLGSPVEATTNADGSIGWSFTVPGTTFDYLHSGDFADISFTIQIRDEHGNVFDRIGKIYVDGVSTVPTDALPVLSGTTTADASRTEAAGVSGSFTTVGASGTLRFTDNWTIKPDGLTVVSVAASGAVAGLPSNNKLMSWLFINSPSVTTGGSGFSGSAAWSFGAQDLNFDYLGVGETVTLTYTVEIADQMGGKITTPITIAVTGTNDGPSYAGGNGFAGLVFDPEAASATVEGTGSISFTDLDRTDVHQVGVTGVATFGKNGGLPDTSVLESLLTFDAPSEPTGFNPGSIGWHFAADASTFGLGDWESVTLQYTVAVSDGHGGSFNSVVTVVVSGQPGGAGEPNHAPVTAVPETLQAITGTQISIAGVNVTDLDTESFETITLIAGHGRLEVPENDNVSVSGNNGRALTLFGRVSDLNDLLGSLTYQSLNGAEDSILVTTSDGIDSNQHSIVVTGAGGTITAGSAGDTLVGGTGNDSFAGGAKADTFAFHAGFGLDTIYGFAASGSSHDYIQVDSSMFADWAHLLGATQQVGSDLVTTLDSTDTITLKNIALANFTSSDARFV